MGLFFLKRFITLLATLFGASVVVFMVLEILPGNAAQILMGPDAAPEAVAALASKLGLDQPAALRYWQWVSGLMVGDMGESYAYSSPVLELVLELQPISPDIRTRRIASNDAELFFIRETPPRCVRLRLGPLFRVWCRSFAYGSPGIWHYLLKNSSSAAKWHSLWEVMALMETQPAAPGPEPQRQGRLFTLALKGVGFLLLFAVISAGAAYGVFEWRIRQEQTGMTAQVTTLRDELRQRQDQLEQQVTRVEKAAASARILLDQSGTSTTLDARLAEIDTLKLELKKGRDETDAKLKALEKSVVDQVAKQGKETAQALSLELRWKTLLIKAQGEILLAQVQWAEGNRGLAKDELGIAAGSLRQALEQTPDASKDGVKQLFDLAEQTRSALILEQSSARDSLNLLWHRVSDLLAPAKS